MLIAVFLCLGLQQIIDTFFAFIIAIICILVYSIFKIKSIKNG